MQVVESALDQPYVPPSFLAPGLWNRPRRPRPAARPPETVTGRDLLTSHLPVVNSAITFVARQRQLSPDERAELASLVYVRLLDNNCAALRQFRAESSLRTFLVVVVQRILIDAHIARYGKWRPSRRALRLGSVAMELERLVYRDGLSLHHAAEILRNRLGISDTDDELSFQLSLLPRRRPRRFVGLDAIQNQAAAGPAPDEGLMDAPARHAMAALQESVSRLSAGDRRLLRLHFGEGRRLSDIARLEGVNQKSIYPRLEKLLKGLRTELQARGISEAVV